MSGERDRFLALSPTFYGKEKSLNDLCLEAENFITNNPDMRKFLANYKEVQSLITGRLREQRILLTQNPALFQLVFEVLEKSHTHKMLLMVLLPTLDGILFDDRAISGVILRTFASDEIQVIHILHQIITMPDFDTIVYESCARVLSILISEMEGKAHLKEQENFLLLLVNYLAKEDSAGRRKIHDHSLVLCLANLLRRDDLSLSFLKNGGIVVLLSVIKRNLYDVQVMYYTCLNFWLLSYYKESAKYFAGPASGIIRNVITIIQNHSREKIWRVAFYLFKNLSNLHENTIEIMVDCGLLKVVDTLLKGNIKDTELKEDLETMGTLLEKNLKILTSFEKYMKEITSANLEWSTVHSEKFWKDNVKKFEENDFNLIKKLVVLLDSENPKNQAIACYDLGEFCRFHPFGKNVLEKIDGKKKISDLMQHKDSSVRENAVLALQKVMLHNWQI
eukprot:TRINITY_DN3543_c0_g1_i3.p1 TRINITY_DN3543_c0_g1~~TRINITY_DN3543_c0_g1_i3.p1  ORF type:complete len:449 (+),score=100.02 TRINITY_DN3543_c0_g1_i3:117-1463(+)